MISKRWLRIFPKRLGRKLSRISVILVSPGEVAEPVVAPGMDEAE
jgi:hypothetical protein